MAGQFGYRASLPGSIVSKFVPTVPGKGYATGQGLQMLGHAIQSVGYQQGEINQQVEASNARIRELEQRRQRASETADAMGRLAEMQVQAAKDIDQQRQESDPGAPNHAANAEQLYRDRATEFLGTLPDDPEIRNTFGPMLARWTASGIIDERTWESGQRAKYQGNQLEASLETQAAGLFTNPSGVAFSQTADDFDKAIDLLDADGTAKEALRRAVREKLAAAVLGGTLEQPNGYAAVEEAMKQGTFDQWIGGAEGKARWVNSAQTARDVAIRQQAASEAEVKRQGLEGLKTIEARIDAGDFPTQGEIEQALAQAKASGVEEADMVKFADLGERSIRRKQAAGVSTAVLDDAIKTLDQKRSAGKATSDDIRQLEEYQAERKDRADKKAGALSTVWGQGDQGKQQVVASLAAMPAAERWRSTTKEMGNAAWIAGLNPPVASLALRGKAVRSAQPDAFMPLTANGKADKAAIKAQWDRLVPPAIQNQLGSMSDDALDSALDILAGTQAGRGSAGAWSDKAFYNAVMTSFGGTVRQDGRWQGGLGTFRGKTVVLPETWTATEMDAALSRLDYSGAAYAGGGAAQKPDVLKNFRPMVYDELPDGTVRYRLDDAQGRSLISPKAGNVLFLVTLAPGPKGR